MDNTTNVTSGTPSDNNAFTPYSKGDASMPTDTKSDATPRAVGKTSAPHQMGNGNGQSTTEYFGG